MCLSVYFHFSNWLYSDMFLFFFVLLTVCRGRKWHSSVVDNCPRSRNGRGFSVEHGLLGPVHLVVIHGLHHLGHWKHDGRRRLGSRPEFLRKLVRLSSHVPWLVVEFSRECPVELIYIIFRWCFLPNCSIQQEYSNINEDKGKATTQKNNNNNRKFKQFIEV